MKIKYKYTSITTLLVMVAAIALFFTMTRMIEFSGLAFGIAKIALFVAVVGVVDNILFGSVDTIKEIVTEKNMAYAIVYGSIILGVGMCVASV